MSPSRVRSLGFARNLQRPPEGENASRVTFVELFFDLVFVFAVTQISHLLIAHPDVPTLIQTLILTSAAWWVWVNTAWVTNWLNPEFGAVRAMLMVLMLLGLLMSSALPTAFSTGAPLFAIAYVSMQVGRSVFTALALRRHWPDNYVNFLRISVWAAGAGTLWLAGAFAPEEYRLPIWLAAVLLEYLGPVSKYVTPGLGASAVQTWNVSGEHMAERAGLFIIISLGESIIVTGTAFGEQEFGALSLVAFLSAFGSTVLMWLLYFNHGARGGRRFISRAHDTGSIARLAYTYLHIPLVLGIVLTAVADELVLLHPLGVNEGGSLAWTAGLICGAGAVYLLGNAFFKRSVGGPWLLSHFAGVVGLAALFAVHWALTPLALNWLSNAVLLAVVIADEAGFRRNRARGRERRDSAGPGAEDSAEDSDSAEIG
jgi:low temperature requirement protein LtrA